MAASKDALLKDLESRGLHFSHFRLSSEGDYAASDAIWNYRDGISHLRHIHNDRVDNIPVSLEDDRLISIYLEKPFGLLLPIIVIDAGLEPFSQTALTTFFFFVIVVHNACEALSENRTRVTTDYHIGGPRSLRFLMPLMRFILRWNYRFLMSADIPLRRRRGLLRSWGYRFKNDKDGGTYRDAADLATVNVIPPPPNGPGTTVIDLDQDLPEDKDLLVGGRDDYYGLRIRRQGPRILIFRRLCPHQGASLDAARCADSRLLCPWHGAANAPLAAFALDEAPAGQVSTPEHRFELRGRILTIEVRASS